MRWWNARRLDECPVGVKTGKARCEHMFSALPLRADIAQCSRHVRFVPRCDIGERCHTDPPMNNCGKSATSALRCVGRLPIQQNIVHPDFHRDFHVRVRQNIEFRSFTASIVILAMSAADSFPDLIACLMRSEYCSASGFESASSAGRLRSEFDIPVSTNAGHSTETPIGAFWPRSS